MNRQKKNKQHGGLPPDRYLTQAEAQKIKDYLIEQVKCSSHLLKKRAEINLMIIDLLFHSGLRASELCQLDLRDLPSYHHKLAIYVRDGKGHIQRPVEISSGLAQRLKRFINKYRRGLNLKKPLFVNENGSRLSYRSLYSKVRIIGQKTIGSLFPHKLRHTYATLLYNQVGSNDLYFLQDQLGHSDVNTTHIYAVTSNVKRRQLVENFGI